MKRKRKMKVQAAKVEKVHVLLADVRGEFYALLYSDEKRWEAAKTLGRWASDPRLSLRWSDAAKMARRIKA